MIGRRHRAIVNSVYAIGGVVALVLFVYLFVAMLKPEWFE
jgi:K+-transporting ATPase KdpF subunit